MNESKFSKETFWSLLTKNGGIVIPIIQRAYTQGGRGKGKDKDEAVVKKGEAFLACLVDALIQGKPIELDFIYGTAENGKIQPLDGQQRLTTLFLLHWYVAQKEHRLDDGAKETLKKFSYETRASSRSFCKALCGFLVPETDTEEEAPALSEIIEDQGWFILSWKNDPSVSSMLGMLNQIHNTLKDVPITLSLWDTLTSKPDIAPITFFYTPLEAFNLTDELYIKMNARGKELTAFEKTKAAIEKKIDDCKWDEDKRSVEENFGNLMDNEWTDLFWQFHDNRAYQIDHYILRLFSAVMICLYADTDTDRAKRLFNNPTDFSSDDLEKESYDTLCETLNLFHSAWKCQGENQISTAPFWWGNSRQELSTFNEFFKVFIAYGKDDGKMTWQQLALCYGFCVYLKENAVREHEANLADWLRFVRNLLVNVRVDELELFTYAKKCLDEMAQSSGDIYGYLATATITNGFAKAQMEEEIRKAKIYASSPVAKATIQSLEDCNFCRGSVSFILDCLDIGESVPDLDRLTKMEDIVFEHLAKDEISPDFRRALATIGDQLYYEFKDWTTSITERDIYYGAQYCLIPNNNNAENNIRSFAQRSTFGLKYLKPLLLRLVDQGEKLSQIIESFEIPDGMPNWKRLLIKCPDWMERDYPFLIDDGERVFLRKTIKARSEENVIEIK